MADATILIVEDEEKMRRLFDLVLRPEGYHLLQADSGEAALKLLEEGGVDLVLTDLQMAKVSGLEVLEHVTKDYPELPVVIITGYGTVKSAVEAVKKGAFDYISKPVDNDELKIVIRRALEMRRLTQEHRGLSQELRERFWSAARAERARSSWPGRSTMPARAPAAPWSRSTARRSPNCC